MHVVMRDCIVELDEQLMFIIYRNRKVLVPKLSLNNDHVVNRYACEVVIQWKAHPQKTQTAGMITHSF